MWILGVLLAVGTFVTLLAGGAWAAAPYDACELPGPDASGYKCSVLDSSQATWYALDGSATQLTFYSDEGNVDNDDGVSNEIPLGFDDAVVWYGNAYDGVRVSSNGYLCFPTDGNTVREDCWGYFSQDVPDDLAPNDLLACLWEDLDPSADGTVSFQRFDTDADGSPDLLVVEFDGVPHWDTSKTNTFQIQVFENGVTECVYQSVTDDEDEGQAAAPSTAVGTENEDGTIGVRYTYSAFSTSPATGEDVAFAVRFDPWPGDPSDLSVLQVDGTNQAALTWSAPASDFTGEYIVYRQAGDGESVPVALVTDPEHTDAVPAHLGCAFELTYEVIAYNGPDYDSAPTAPASLTLEGCPGQPRSAGADGVATARIDITWQPPETDADAVDRYHVYRCPGTAGGSCASSLSPAEIGSSLGTSYADTSVVPGSGYCYQVRAGNEVGHGPPTALACGYTWPTKPTSVSVSSSEDRSVSLDWSSPGASQLVDGYVVYRNGRAYASSSSLAYTDQDAGVDAGPGEQLCYEVVATTPEGDEGVPSWPACIGTPGPVENLTALPGTNTTTLAWEAPSDRKAPVAAASSQDAAHAPDDNNATITTYNVTRCRLGDATAYNPAAEPNCTGAWEEVGSMPADSSTDVPPPEAGSGQAGTVSRLLVFEDEPETAGTYLYRVQAVNNLGEGEGNETVGLVATGPVGPAPDPGLPGDLPPPTVPDPGSEPGTGSSTSAPHAVPRVGINRSGTRALAPT